MGVVADLHTHTTVTDGRQSPADLVLAAAAAGLSHLVITDHSVVTWDDALHKTARRAGVDLPFPGVELSTVHGGRRHHLIVYGHGVLDPTFQAEVRHPLEWKNRLLGLTCAHLRRQGHDVPDLADIMAHGLPLRMPTPEKQMASRTAIAAAVAEAGSVTHDHAYHLVAAAQEEVESGLGDEGAPERRYLATLAVLRQAVSVGAVPVLAHPLWRCRGEDDIAEVMTDLELFATEGLRATESRSYHHRPLDDHPDLLGTRARLGLLASGGSDYHANGKTELGRGGLDTEDYERLAAAVEATERDWERERRAHAHAG